MRPGRLLFPAVAMLAWFGCATEPEVDPDLVVATIGANGGTLVSRDSLVMLTIPAGALSAATPITITSIDPQNLPTQFAGLDIAGAYDFGPHGTTFAVPVTVTVRSGQQVVQTDSSLQFTPENLFTVGGDSLESLDSLRMEMRADTLLVSGQMSHFSPVVESRRNGSLTATLSGVPDVSEVGVVFGTKLLVTWIETLPSGQLRNLRWDTEYDAVPVRGSSINSDDFTATSAVDFEGLIPFICAETGTGAAVVEVTLIIGTPGSLGHRERFFIYKSLECVPGAPKNLSIAMTGTGTGTVTTSPAGIDCPGDCSETFDHETRITITATAAAGSAFIGWFDDCPYGFPRQVTFNIVEHRTTCTAQFDALPAISDIQPTFMTVGTGGLLTVNGSRFSSASTINVGGVALTTTFVNDHQLTAVVPGNLAVGTTTVTVTTPPLGTSLPVVLELRNPIPGIQFITPKVAYAGQQSDVGMIVRGFRFVAGAVVRFGGTALETDAGPDPSVDLITTIPASLLASPGTVNVWVENPGPGLPYSPSETFTILPAVTFSSIQPTQATIGSGLTITVNGSNFAPFMEIAIDGTRLQTTFVSPQQLTATVSHLDLGLTPGQKAITIVDGHTILTAPLQLEVRNPMPVIDLLEPSRVIVGESDLLVLITGSGFAMGAVARFGGTALSTGPGPYATGTSLVVTIPEALIASPGTVPVVVENPGPGTPTSVPVPFTIHPRPTISSFQPTSATAGAGFTITINGTGFIQGQSKVVVDGIVLTTTWVSDQQLTATAPAFSTTGVKTVGVTTFGRLEMASGGVNIQLPAPRVDNLSPSSATAGGPAFTLTVTGANFQTGAVVRFAGTQLTITGSQTAQSLQAQVTAALIANPGTALVVVENPDGQTSTPVPFTINSSAPDPCTTPVDVNWDAIFNQTLGPGDCTATYGGGNIEYFDLLRVTTQQQAINLQLTGTPLAYVVIGDANVDFGEVFSSGSQSSLRGFLPAGQYLMVVGSNSGTNPQRTYSLRVAPSANTDLVNCQNAFARPGGVTITGTLATTDCFGNNRSDPNAGITNYDFVNVRLAPGESVTITMSSTDFDPVVMAICTNGSFQTRTFIDDNSGGGTTARLVITSINGEDCRVEFTSRGQNRGPYLGAYTVTIQ